MTERISMLSMRLVMLLASLVPAIASAQRLDAIEEIVVTAATSGDRVRPASLVLDREDLTELQPVATADVFRNVTGISLRTNSRGESVIRVRGAEERQTLIFLDGAPLATPWDGRADLALLPAGLIDRVEVTRGAAPIEYGANAVAGVVDLSTGLPEVGADIRAELQHGSLGLSNLNTVASLGLENGFSMVGGVSKIERDAERIAERSSVVFDPSTDDARTNTDLSGNSAYIATAYAANKFAARVSLLHADVERGVAARGDLDPATANPRFWRTPLWRLTQATLNSNWAATDWLDLKVTGWRQWFEQTIDAYSDYSYTTIQGREEGDDDTVGARVVAQLALRSATVRIVTTTQESTHRQRDFSLSGNPGDALVSGPLLRYRQRLSTAGLEADFRLGERLTATLGVARDRAQTPLTGDKPAQPDLSATGWSAGLRWRSDNRFALVATIGERTRFPTPRELYGQALGKFLLNPDLRPERSLLADVSVLFDPSEKMAINAAAWINDSDDTLSQRSVIVADGSSRRQRFNTNGTFTYGLELATTLFHTDSLRTEYSLAWQDGQVEPDADGNRPALLQRPEVQLRAAIDWQANERIDLRAEALYTGSAFDLADDGSVATLPGSTAVNLRGFLQIGAWRGRDVQLTASVDNLTDELVLPQLGLPAPGRSYRVGLQLN